MKNKIILFLFVVLFGSCFNNRFQDIYSIWMNKNIQIPENLLFFTDKIDSVKFDNTAKLKILLFTDSTGCVSCKVKLREWQSFNEYLDSITNNKVPTYIVLSTKEIQNKSPLIRENYQYPICVDKEDELNKLNDFYPDDRFRCFLLDENNKVVLIGNPIYFPKIKDLYIRTICERLGIDTTNIKIAENRENRFSFGRFPFTLTKRTNFVLKNDNLVEMKIDTIFTSCECTSASANKSIININDSAIISVTFKTDKPEEFSREVYVKTNSREKPIVYTVDGVAF